MRKNGQAEGQGSWMAEQLDGADRLRDPSHQILAGWRTDGLTTLMVPDNAGGPFSDAVRACQSPSVPSPNADDSRPIDDRLWDIFVHCWKKAPNARPNIKEVIKVVEEVQRTSKDDSR